MTRLLSIALLAATLSAQTISSSGERREFLTRPGDRTLTDDSVGRNGSMRRRGRTLLAAGCWRLAGRPPLRNTNEQFRQEADQGLPALTTTRQFDNNGALEGFYKPHHSHRKAWLTIGILIGSGVATGLLATRASHPPIGRPIMPATPAPVTPVFGGVSFIGIGGPGVPVTISKGGN